MYTIITIIKDEHLYLKDWIEYHINLGIDQFFIFEDFGSKSHKDITKKYDYVNLLSLSEITNKRTDKYRQICYTRDCLKYIKDNFKCDWLFVIDIDEYITTNSLNLDKYNNYDCIILYWKNFGANGLIHKPDYSTKSIVEIYTKKCPIIDEKCMKICYNMNTFNIHYYISHHQINRLICKWCNSDFSTENKIIYDNIYLRHYITKSYEEWIDKLTVRGQFIGHRQLEDFFKMNPEMKYPTS